jgi:hypothetical protein
VLVYRCTLYHLPSGHSALAMYALIGMKQLHSLQKCRSVRLGHASHNALRPCVVLSVALVSSPAEALPVEFVSAVSQSTMLRVSLVCFVMIVPSSWL